MSRERIESAFGDLKCDKISQGAEAIVFLANRHPLNGKIQKTIIKYRPKKPYRYYVLDKQIIKQRTISESRIMLKLFQNSIQELNKQKKTFSDIEGNGFILDGGVNCPRLIQIDVSNGLIFMEYVNSFLKNGENSSLKNYLWLLENEMVKMLPKGKKLNVQTCDEFLATADIKSVFALNDKTRETLTNAGIVIGNLHLFDIIHGDLTSSNIVLKACGDQCGTTDNKNEKDDLQPLYQPFLIDFGLSYQSTLVEDKAVDLYVLEKALESTHPLFHKQYSQWILEGYEQSHILKGKRENSPKIYKTKYNEIIKRLEAVRLRGRKRSMIG